jgi:hypothetical protein
MFQYNPTNLFHMFCSPLSSWSLYRLGKYLDIYDSTFGVGTSILKTLDLILVLCWGAFNL